MDKEIITPSTDTDQYAEMLFRESENGIIIDSFPKQLVVSEHLLDIGRTDVIRREDDVIIIQASNGWAKYEIINYEQKRFAFKAKLLERGDGVRSTGE